ncbi:MAG: hypothetical protein ABIN89_22850 [Chitinophagaceae bacterium]
MIHLPGHIKRILHFKNAAHYKPASCFAILFVLTIARGSTILKAQGCSDAGFCTIGNLHQLDQPATKKRVQKISIVLPLGIGDEKVFVFSPGVQYENKLNE